MQDLMLSINELADRLMAATQRPGIPHSVEDFKGILRVALDAPTADEYGIVKPIKVGDAVKVSGLSGDAESLNGDYTVIALDAPTASETIVKSPMSLQELESILNSEDDRPIKIMPDGSIVEIKASEGMQSAIDETVANIKNCFKPLKLTSSQLMAEVDAEKARKLKVMEERFTTRMNTSNTSEQNAAALEADMVMKEPSEFYTGLGCFDDRGNYYRSDKPPVRAFGDGYDQS